VNRHAQNSSSARSSGGHLIHSVLMRSSTARENSPNSTAPTVLQGKSGKPLRRLASWTRHPFISKVKVFSDNCTSWSFNQLYIRNRKASAKAGRPPPALMPRASMIRRASIGANLRHASRSYLIASSVPKSSYTDKHQHPSCASQHLAYALISAISSSPLISSFIKIYAPWLLTVDLLYEPSDVSA